MNSHLLHPSDLFFHQIRALRSAETQLLLTLPVFLERCTHPALKQLLRDAGHQAEQQQERLLGILQGHDVDPFGDICRLARSLMVGEEGIQPQPEDPRVRDLLVIAHCNRIKYHGMAAYGFAASLADCLGYDQDAAQLRTMAGEEQRLSERLTDTAVEVAEAHVAAAGAS